MAAVAARVTQASRSQNPKEAQSDPNSLGRNLCVPRGPFLERAAEARLCTAHGGASDAASLFNLLPKGPQIFFLPPPYFFSKPQPTQSLSATSCPLELPPSASRVFSFSRGSSAPPLPQGASRFLSCFPSAAPPQPHVGLARPGATHRGGAPPTERARAGLLVLSYSVKYYQSCARWTSSMKSG